MAKYGIFYDNKLVKIAADESARDVHLARWVNSVAKEITDSQWNSYFEGSKTASLSGDTITDTDIDSVFSYDATEDADMIATQNESRKEIIKHIVKDQIRLIKGSKADVSDSTWNDYVTKLESVNVETDTLPTSGYFQTWFNTNYNNSKSILELP